MLYLSASQIRSSHLVERQLSAGKSIKSVLLVNREQCKLVRKSNESFFACPGASGSAFVFYSFDSPAKQLDEQACKLCKSANHKRDSHHSNAGPSNPGLRTSSFMFVFAMLCWRLSQNTFCSTYAQQEKSNPNTIDCRPQE